MTRLSWLRLALAASGVLSGLEQAPLRAGGESTGVTIESLGNLVIPQAALPTGEVSVSFVYETIPAGVSFDLPSGAPTIAADATVQLTGTVELTWGATLHLIRADGTELEIAPGTPVIVNAGDRFMVADAVPAKKINVLGSTTVEWLDLYLADGTYPEDPFWVTYLPPEEYHARVIGKLTPYEWLVSGLGAADLNITFQRTTFSERSRFNFTHVDPLILSTVETGTVVWSFTRTGVNPVAAHPVECVEGTVIPWLPLDPQEHITLTNSQPQPATLLQVVLSPIA
jgi:hypothetical protein